MWGKAQFMGHLAWPSFNRWGLRPWDSGSYLPALGVRSAGAPRASGTRLQAWLAAVGSEGSCMPTGGHWSEHLPCSTSPMVVPQAAVDIVAGAVVCLPTVSTGLEMREGRTQTGEGRGEGRERQRKQKKIRFKA